MFFETLTTEKSATEDLFSYRESVFREDLFLYNCLQRTSAAVWALATMLSAHKWILSLSLVSTMVQKEMKVRDEITEP